MAAPAKPKPGRFLAVVALALIGLYLGVFLGPAATPSLGLDLRGGTQATLTAHPIGNGKVTKSQLGQAANIIRDRVNGLGVGGATVSTQGSANIVVSVPGKGRSAVLDTVGTTALLRFRQVMAWTATNDASTTVTPSASASSSATPGASPSVTVSPTTTPAISKGGSSTSSTAKSTPSTKSTSQGQPLSAALRKGVAKKKKPKATPTATPRSSSTASPTTSATPGATASVTASPSATSTAPPPAPTPAAGGNKPAPNTESPTITAALEQRFASWNCLKNDNPTNGVDNPSDYIISCNSTPDGLTYLLGPSKIEGKEISGASDGIDQTGQWVVNLTFNGKGSSAWQSLTSDTYNIDGGVADVGQAATSATATCSPPKGCNAVSITLDGQVASAPYSETKGGIPGGQTQISGSFTQKQAEDLANVLKYGALPVKFTTPDVQSVSATLGKQQLRGGLIAGVIGLGLVVLFSLLYYRALGLVTVGSLAVSGLILYAITTLLGHSSVGYTLSLPGIAGFIVAIGITADSFVVFFERLRDEIREGRRLRSGVERAWPRARRTIISADSVSLLAAVVLYAVSIGDVRGFAFTLGLSTISDLFIVFFFTKPLLSVLAKVKAFDSGKSWTGVGRARAGVVREAAPDFESRSSRRTRTREA